MRSYAQSAEWYERAKAVTPGAAQTSSKAPGRVGPLGAYPLVLGSGEGCYVTSLDYQNPWELFRYVDWYGGNCAVTLGHGHKAITEAVTMQLRSGVLLPLPHPLEAVVANELCRVIPCAESVRFVKTGSESTEGAIRLARAFTGRNLIIITDASYHSWHAWYTVTKAQHPGVPEWMAQGVRVVPHGVSDGDHHRNGMDALNTALALGDVAMVFVEPQFYRDKEAEYLTFAQDLARRHGALFGLDEMVAGGRLALGGAQEAYNLKPDLATFGKSFAQGLPLAFVCGRRDIMESAWTISGTFGGELLSLAACQATLKEYQEHGVIARMHEVGQQLIDGFNGIAARLDVPVRLTGHPSRPQTTWTHSDVNLCRSLMQQELAERGVITHYGAWNPSAAHTAEAIEQTLTACRGALAEMVSYLASDNLEQFLRGERIQDSVRTAEGVRVTV